MYAIAYLRKLVIDMMDKPKAGSPYLVWLAKGKGWQAELPDKGGYQCISPVPYAVGYCGCLLRLRDGARTFVSARSAAYNAEGLVDGLEPGWERRRCGTNI